MDGLGPLPDWILTALSLLGLGGGGGAVGYVRRVDTKAADAKSLAEYNNARLEGTVDPNDEGVLQIANDTRERVARLEQKMDNQHRALMVKFEEAQSDREGDYYRGGE